MLTRSQMITEATRRLNAGEDPDTVLQDIFDHVLDAVTYAARKSRKLDAGEGCVDDLITACEWCAEVIAEEEEEE